MCNCGGERRGDYFGWFIEAGPAGAELEKQILKRRGKMRIIGPNCVGVMLPHIGLNATFAKPLALPGNIGFITQSGALCTAILDWSRSTQLGSARHRRPTSRVIHETKTARPPDIVMDQTEDGRRLKMMMVVDEYTRECLTVEVQRSITAEDVVATLTYLFEERGEPSYIRSDNGPEFVAAAVKRWLWGLAE